MTADQLPEIAASVAKALGLQKSLYHYWFDQQNKLLSAPTLQYDGSNLFDPYWQVRCRGWLLERTGASIGLYNEGRHEFYADSTVDGRYNFSLACPVSEFCARAIHELMRKSK